ncbi:MAG: MlaD family protein [Desulfovibrio sp.]|jgi:phospholipid/cholesterol/gamma-HCH transport system substrate-binding protein|nr:MlaD family protein [Desulfovibrio sp.]
METRAGYFLVGAFTLVMFAAATVFTLWLADRDRGREPAEYDISFSESVKGLSVNSDVLFVGVRVGRVKTITVSDVTPGAVRVRIAVDGDIPVREDSRAKLDLRGITGSSVISISGGTAGSPLMHVAEGEVGEILAEPSTLNAVVASMPQVLAKFEKLLSAENIAAAGRTLNALGTLTEAIASQSETLKTLPLKYARAADSLSMLIANIDELLVKELRPGVTAFHGVMRRADDTLGAIEPGVKQAGGQGLADLRLLVADLRNLTQAMTHVVRKMEADPKRFFFGDQYKEIQNQ